IQAYNHRLCLTNQEGNRRLLERPPPGYKREEYVNFNRKYMSAGALNGKSSWNAAILPGENHAYPDAPWPQREKIIERHKNFALGLMWFLQNDESVKPATRARNRQIGLPLDEFPDNDNLPYEIYVREARRIVGRYVYREQDNSFAPGLGRAPIQPDSVAFTDWPMDSHECTTDRRPGYDFDGKLILTEESRPGQIPYRCLLPQGVDNLLVPVCLSATHVAWGAVRLEPVFMQTGEAAGFAAALSKKRGGTPAALDSDLLVRTLCRAGCVVTFFNEREAIRHPAAQYFGTKGFFHDYNARLNEPLKPATARVWADSKLAPNARACAVAEAEKSATTGTLTRGAVLQSMWESLR
ncbi:MAG: FAD-dependent oxidoreductase, partial [Verrucomicrobiae bacterium]|nr:FAD-dependent oxidoreductase [Verrucomicrobiae bacterium]